MDAACGVSACLCVSGETAGRIGGFSLGRNDFKPIMQKDVLEEIRCRHCGKLLARGQAKIMEFKCPRCGAFTILRAMRPCSESPDGQNGANCDKGLSE